MHCPQCMNECMHVTPRSRGYGDVTATYIRKSKIPPRIYTKHQYRQELECGSTVIIYIPIEKYKYMLSQRVIQYYRNITSLKIQNNIIHEEIYITKRCSRYSKRTSGAKQERNWEEELRWRPSYGCALTTTGGSAAHSDQLQPSYQGPDSRIWT